MDYQHLNAGQKGKGRSVVDYVEIPPIPIVTHLQKGTMGEDVQNFASGRNPDCLFSGKRSTRNICNYMFFLLFLLFSLLCFFFNRNSSTERCNGSERRDFCQWPGADTVVVTDLS